MRDLDSRERDDLEEQGLVHRVALNENERAVVLTEQGRGLLERHRDGNSVLRKKTAMNSMDRIHAADSSRYS